MPIPIGRLLSDLAQADPDKPAVTCDGVTATRGQLEQRANRLARAYEAHGVRQADFVTIAAPNGIEFVASAFAVWKLGAVVQPVSSRLPWRERQGIIDLADPALILGVPADAHPGRACLPAGFVPDVSLSDTPIAPDRVSPAWKAPTSGGSTGTPKLIVSGQNGEIDPAQAAVFGLRENGVVLVAGPLYHNMPFTNAFSSLFFGCHVVLLSRFDAVAALRAIQTHRVEFVNVVPTMMLRMWRVLEQDPQVYDLSSVEVFWHMAAPCPRWLKMEWIRLLGPGKVFELYGGTEGQAMTTITGTEWLDHPGSVGRPVFGAMRILNSNGDEVPRRAVGEIFMRRPPGAPETYRYIGAEARVRGDWESLGDLGWMDEDGYLYISDRRVDMIVSGGANIYPAEVEAALVEHPSVESAVVVGLPDEDLGQRVHAVVQAVGAVTEAQLLAFLTERLVRYKIPRSFRFVNEPLRDDAGKVRRSAVRDREIDEMNAHPA